MTTAQNREPRGVPVGGQFAPSENPEAQVDIVEPTIVIVDRAPLVLGQSETRPRRPYERRYGAKYEDARNLGVTEIAGLMRQDIKQAVANGDLPKDDHISVTTQKYAGGASIDIKVSNWAGATVPADDSRCTGQLDLGTRTVPSSCKPGQHDWRCPGAAHESEEGARVRETIQAIHDSYNHDGSDVMTDYFDVRYYGQAKVEEFHAPVIDPSLPALRKTGTMADLKRTIKVGTVLEVTQNPRWPEAVGLKRPVTKAQTGSFAMRTRKSGTDRDVDSWMDFGRASELTYDKDAGEFQIGDIRFRIVDGE
jgi:hypothetical protein